MKGHPLETAKSRYPLPPEHFPQYLMKGAKPPLAVNQLVTQLFCGTQEQQHIKMPYGGNTSLLLSYKGYEGALASWQAEDEDLQVVALQGAKSRKSWRVAQAVNWPKLFAHESLAIAKIPEAGIRRITMPDIRDIKNFYASAGTAGNYEAITAAETRYHAFIAIAMLNWSEKEKLFVRDIT